MKLKLAINLLVDQTLWGLRDNIIDVINFLLGGLLSYKFLIVLLNHLRTLKFVANLNADAHDGISL